MATSVEARHAAPQRESRIELLLGWLKGHRQAAFYFVGAVGLGAFLFAWNLWSRRQSDATASEQLQQARYAFEVRNLPLAASEFSRIMENYSGTRAAQEGALLLAQVRLLQGQSEQAVQVLTRFAGSADAAYQAQAYGLLGAAYENLARFREAADAYERAAGSAKLDFLRAQYLVDAGRVWGVAGDTSRALGAYGQVVRDLSETGSVGEARVRIGELTKGSGLPQ